MVLLLHPRSLAYLPEGHLGAGVLHFQSQYTA